MKKTLHDHTAIKAHRHNFPTVTALWASIECEQRHFPAGKKSNNGSMAYCQQNTLPVIYKGGNNS